MKQKNLTLFLIILLLLPISLFASTINWPLKTDIKPDPSIKYGILDNGFRYVIKYNKRPEKRVSIMLDVQVGSINEKDNERGTAHYLEHMVFNGSKHFKPDELVKFFQRIGMAFGPDANAHTGFNETVYKILLPQNNTKLIEEGFLVMRDYADGALLLEKETQKEKGVILSEKMTRDSADFREMVAELGFLYKDSNIDKRLPIGTDETIKAVTSKSLKHFYNKWYTPDNMVLIVVGDINLNKTEKLIKKYFASMKKKKAPKDEIYIYEIKHKKDSSFYYYDKNAGKTTIGIWKVDNVKPKKDSIETRKDELIKDIINIAFYFRLQEEMNKEDTVFTDIQFIIHNFLNRYSSIGIQADTKAENWEKALMNSEQLLRQAIKYGFTDNEIETAKNYIKANLKEALLTSETRKSTSISSELVHNINSNKITLSPQQEEKLYSKLMKSIDVKTVNYKLKSLWNGKPTLLTLSGNIKLDNNTAKNKILDTYKNSLKINVNKRKSSYDVKFPYLKIKNKKSKIIDVKIKKPINVKTILLDNNVCINLKKTDFDKGKIYIAINFGRGEFDEPANKPALSDVAEYVIDNSGLGKVSNEELSKILAGKITSINFTIGQNSFTISGTTTQKEQELFLELAYHLLKDPAYRKNVYKNYMKKIQDDYAKNMHNIQAVYGLEIMRFLSSNDHRLSKPTLKEIFEVSLEDIKNWTKPIFENSELEINIVGDFNEKNIINQIEKYFGSLSKRKKIKTFIYEDKIKFPYGKKLVKNVDTNINKSIVNVIYPTTDKRNILEARKLTLLASLIEEKMRVEIREKLGETYSPFAHNISSEIYKDFGFIRTFVFTSPDKTEQIVKIIKKISDNIVKNGITEDEMIRIKKPILTEIKEQVKTNPYWLYSVLSGSKYNKNKLDWAKTILNDYEKISINDLNEIAGKYLNNESAATIIIEPTLTNHLKPD